MGTPGVYANDEYLRPKVPRLIARFIPAFKRKRPYSVYPVAKMSDFSSESLAGMREQERRDRLPLSPQPDSSRKWQVWLVLIGLALTVATLLFNAGITKASDEARIQRLEGDVKQIFDDYERKDVLEQRLSNIEQEEKRIEANEEEQAETLQKLLVTVGRR